MHELLRLTQYLPAYFTYKQRLAKFLNVSLKHIDSLYKEVPTKTNIFDLSMKSVLKAPTLYVICRITSPRIVVETGVSEGFSSAFILKAMEKNNYGHLYSIDLPDKISKPTGWLVEDELRYRWTLIVGSSKDKLFPLLESLNIIDIFIHDSDHSYTNMIFEFLTAQQYIDNLLISDDITDNTAFFDLCYRFHYRSCKLFKVGVAKCWE